MKITICGSVAFINEMVAVARELEVLGHEVKLPPTTKTGEFGQEISVLEYYRHKKEAAGKPTHWIWKMHDEPIRTHFDKVAWSDAILVLNYEKNDVPGYVGPNTLMEMGVAFYLHKPIFLLNPIPNLPHEEEIRGLKPTLLNGDLKAIPQEIKV
jgi:hypothetical protein